MADQKSVPIRLYIMGRIASNDYWGDKIPRLHNYGPAGRLTVRSIKLVSDGALGSWGAAMIEPYSDSPLTHGLLLTPPDVLEMQVQRFFEDGWQVVSRLIIQLIISDANCTTIKECPLHWRPGQQEYFRHIRESA